MDQSGAARTTEHTDTLTCKACDKVPKVLFCTPMVSMASCTYFLGVGVVKDDLRIPDSFVVTKNGSTLYRKEVMSSTHTSHMIPTCTIIPLSEYS